MYFIVVLLIKLTDYFSDLFGFANPFFTLSPKRTPSFFLKRPGLKFSKGFVLISGDAQKNATGFISCMLRAEGFKVLSNESGLNSFSAIAGSMLMDAGFHGKLQSEIGVFAVSESELTAATTKMVPSAVVLFDFVTDNNLSWKNAVEGLGADTVLLLDCAQEKFYDYPSICKGKPYFFDADPEGLKYTKLLGVANAKCVNAAVCVVSLFGVAKTKALQDLRSVNAASGFGDTVEKAGVRYRIFLARNSFGFNYNVDILLSGKLRAPVLVFILGTSTYESSGNAWLRSINSAKLRQVCDQKSIFVSGNCFEDMSGRLHTAGVTVDKSNVIPNIRKCLKKISVEGFTHAVVFLNYSALLAFEKVAHS